MSLKLMYITNNPSVAEIAQRAGVDRIFIDMEYIGKDLRQGGIDTVKNHHTVADIERLRAVLDKSELLVRINPIHEANNEYCGSKAEIDGVIQAGANVIMLPMFKTVEEVETFVKLVEGRVKTLLLVETKEAVEIIDEILNVDGIDEVHIGLNDLHLSYGLDFMFELLCNDVVKNLCKKFKDAGVCYGFGGIARIGYGMLPSEYIITEHYHLGSTAAILSRGFCDANKITDILKIESLFIEGIEKIRLEEKKVAQYTEEMYQDNIEIIRERVNVIVEAIKNK
ncbi:MAG: aldolase [Eubacterium sp.]|nr:aldolase [Eubacterium sp.]